MKITNVEVSNVMKLQYVKLTPQGNLTIVGGKNEQGKSSLLNSIAMALGGKKLCPIKPIRKGKDMAVIKVKIDGDESLMIPPSTVIRRFFLREDGTVKSEMEIISDDGYQAPEPQTLLNRILSNATFDPLYFTRLKPAEQAKQLRELVGIDTDQLEAKRRMIYETRRMVGREVKQWQGNLDCLPSIHDDVPDKPVSSSDVLAEMEEARAVNQRNAQQRKKLAEATDALDRLETEGNQIDSKIVELQNEILRLEKLVLEKRQQLSDETQKVDELAEQVAVLKDVDLSVFKSRLEQVEEVNEKIRQNKSRQDVAEKVTEVSGRYDELTAEIEEIDLEIASLYESAKWPVEGLGFDEDGVVYREMPFAQCSQAEQLRVSVAMGFALNPTLKLLIVRDGSLLDDDSLKQVAELAESAGGQIFMERVGAGSECHIVLIDGRDQNEQEEVAAEDAEE